MKMSSIMCAAVVTAASASSAMAVPGWESYIIRSTPVINDVNATTKEFIIVGSGAKAAWGTNNINGLTLGDITQLAIDRLDDESRFAAGQGPAVAPYFNIWITNGAGKYAVIANEPSNPDFQALYNDGYDLSWSDIANKVAKVYETTDKTWLPNNGVGLTFADLAGFTIQAPTVAELTVSWAGLGTGAPRELGTNVAYGFNWVFGDTLSNYVSGDDGYIVANPVANGPAAPPVPTPEPVTGTLALGALIALGGYAGSRRR